jgi:hypothetical protein
MSEPDYKARNDNAYMKLEDVEKHLEAALADAELTQETKMHVQTALRHVTEAQSYLRGG